MSQSITGFSQVRVTPPSIIILLPLCSLSRHSPPSLFWCPFEDTQLGCMVPKTGRSFSPSGKGFLAIKALPYLVDHLPPEIFSSCLHDVLPVCPLEGCMPPWGCLPWDIAMGLEQQGGKTQKPKRSKKGHSKCRAISMHSLCTLFCRGFCLHQPGARSGQSCSSDISTQEMLLHPVLLLLPLLPVSHTKAL